MAAGKGEKNDFYAVLGLQKECTEEELRNAYKKLAMRWHPDRFSALGNMKRVEEAKKKFQDIQEAYSVLSDANKRFMYDVGVYEGNEDDENGMGDFLNEMADMMCQHKSNGGGNESFEELQELFDEMFQNERGSTNSDEHGHGHGHGWWASSCSSSSKSSSNGAATSETTTSSTKTKLGKTTSFDAHFDAFSFGVQRQGVQNWTGAGGRKGSQGQGGSSSCSGREKLQKIHPTLMQYFRFSGFRQFISNLESERQTDRQDMFFFLLLNQRNALLSTCSLLYLELEMSLLTIVFTNGLLQQ